MVSFVVLETEEEEEEEEEEVEGGGRRKKEKEGRLGKELWVENEVFFFWLYCCLFNFR